MSYISDNIVSRTGGWLLFLSVLGALAISLPTTYTVRGGAHFLLVIGVIGIWRYSVGFIHFLRAMYFLKWAFPKIRRRAKALGEDAAPSHVYLMVTSFRTDATTVVGQPHSTASRIIEL